LINDRADRSFAMANAVEKIHHSYFEEALKEVKEGKKPAEETYFVCQVCGNTVKGSPQDKCSVCGAPKERFKKVE
jgi:rubrerythrin